MNKNLNDIEWNVFKIEELFIIKKVLGEPIKNYAKGYTPYISNKTLNNGIIDFIKSEKNIISKGNCISIDSIKGKTFFHKHNFVGRGFSGASIHVLYNKNINKFSALFLCKAIEKMAQTKASYGYLFNSDKRLKKAKILLPIDSKGQPNYKFMEEYIKEKEREIKQRYKNFIQKRIEKIQTKVEINKKYKPFLISNVFETAQRGKRLIKDKQIKGITPYISSTATNNGVDNFISNNKNVRKFKNCLSLANSGSVGTCFYEPFEFIASDHVTHLKGNFTKYTYLFLANILNRLSEKYNFNREINDPRIQKEYILLPINSKKEPDYEYMHTYMLYLEQKKILEYLDFIK